MAVASDFQVTFPYGSITPPYSKAHPHPGEDYAMPIGTKVDVGDIVIGLSGATGQVTGPHLHIKKYADSKVQHPQGKGLANTIAFPARVIETGNKSDTGKFVRILDTNKVQWSYFHLSETKAKVGDVINKGDDEVTLVDKNIAADLAAAVLFREGAAQTDPDYLKSVVGQPVDVVLRTLLRSDERKKVQDRLNGQASDADRRDAANWRDLKRKLKE